MAVDSSLTPAIASGISQPSRRRGGRPRDPPNKEKMRIEMTRNPTLRAVTLNTLRSRYGATFFRDALARYVVRVNNPQFNDAQVERSSASVYFNFRTVPVYHKVKFWISDPHGLAALDSETRDVVHVRPARKDKYGNDIPGRFDTALVRLLDGDLPAAPTTSMQRECVPQ